MNVLFLLATVFALQAQQPPASRDPMMNLMVSQPKLAVPENAHAAASFDPPIVRPGEPAYLRIVLDALEESIEWPTNLPAPAQLDIQRGAHGQILQMTGTNMIPRAACNYRVRASSTGTFTIPEFALKVNGKTATVPAAQLEVVSDLPPSAAPPLQLTLELPATNLFVGQAVQARVRLPISPASPVQGLVQPQLVGQGIMSDLGATHQHTEITQRGGVMLATFIYDTTIMPMAAGRLPVYAQGFTIGRRISPQVVTSGGVVILGGAPQYTFLESEPVELNVRPLPREGQLPGFTGAIGELAVGPPTLPTNTLQVGAPVQLTVTVTNRSHGPLARLVPPPPPQVQDWQVFSANDFSPAQPSIPAQPGVPSHLFAPAVRAGLEGVVTFHYTLIPLTEAARATPPIPFSCFDPDAGAYRDLTIPAVPVTVQPGAMPADFASLVQAATVGAEQEKRPTLSSLAPARGRTASSLVPPQQRAWFPFVQLAPAAAFVALLSWDRRRRFREQHPEVILRRRARRALHKQRRTLRRAAHAADAPRFAAAAVSAMRVACAPHYPAEPRALVGADVMPLLPEPDRAGRPGEVVRRFFSVTDAAQFDTAPANASELLPLQPELERVLERLEEKL